MHETVAVPVPRVAPLAESGDRAAAARPGFPPAVDLVIGLGSAVGRLGAHGAAVLVRVTGPASRVPGRLPVVGPELRALSQALIARGGLERAAARARAERTYRALFPRLLDAVLDQLDLTRLVLTRVDLDAIVAGVDVDAVVAGVDVDAIAARVDVDAIAARVDVDAIAARVDVDAVTARADLAGLVYDVLDAIDLPQLIRESTGTVASETVRAVRMQSIELDEHVSRFVDRVLLRRSVRRKVATNEPDADVPTALPLPRQQPPVQP